MSSSYNQIWLSIDNDDGSMKEGFQLPYNPESYKITEGTNEKTVSIAGLGSVTIKNGKSPLQLTFSSYFTPNVEPGIELSEGDVMLDPRDYDNMIREWKNGTSPVHLVITNTNVNAYFSISTYTTEEEGGDIGKISYTLSLKQYGTASGLGAGMSGSGTMVRQIDIDPYQLPSTPNTYTVVKGDTLYSIAQRFYNSTQMAYEIYKLNSSKLKKGVNTKLKKGWVLYMPQ